MKKRSLFGAILLAASMAVTSILPTTVFADATKVVTLGADLSNEQKSKMMKYFKVNKDEVQILFVTNADEKRLLGNYIPASQIGNRTVSCAYVKPTASGGIKVRTANLTYVTCNMIATTLSTSGVSNCEVVAACPFEVSGTGALTGIMLAYEQATGEKLDETKKDIAAHEMVVTKELGESIESSKDAINIINSGKMEVVGNDIQNAEEIQNVVINIAQENNVDISSEQIQVIVGLLEEIAHQDYNYEEMKQTLENVDGNLSEELTPSEDPEEIEVSDGSEEWVSIEAEESILDDVDPSVFDGPVFESSTENPELEEESGQTEPEAPAEDENWDETVWDETDWESIEETPTDVVDETPAEEDWGSNEDVYVEETETPVEEEIFDDEPVVQEEEIPAEDELDLSLLNDEQKEKFEELVKFCKGEFDGDIDTLKEVMGVDAFPSVVLNPEIAEKLSKDVQKAFYELLKEGTDNYVGDAMDEYFTPELNILVKELKELMNLGDEKDPESYLKDMWEDDLKILYDDTVKFFEKLYDESLAPVAEEVWDDNMEESYEVTDGDEEIEEW